MPTVKINLQYKPIDEISQAEHYFKYVPPVFEDRLMFDFASEDYELTQRDRDFLKSDPANNICSNIGEKDFERLIDCLEKVAFVYKDTQPTQVAKYFSVHADAELQRKVTKQQVEAVITQYWKKRRIEQKWHVSMRMFWENPDYNEPDLSAAFRKKSEKEKIKLRPKIEIHKKKL